MSPTEDEIRHIASTGGVIAVIFMNSWLGEHESTRTASTPSSRRSRQITEVGGIDTVAIGSDFDGFTDPPDDLEGHLTDAEADRGARCDAGFGDTEIEKILGLNMERVLREGWR